MPLHTAGWLQSVDPAGAFTDLNALADQTLFTSGKNIRVPALNNVVAVAAMIESTSGNRARIYSPTIDQFARYEISPLNLAAAGAVEPASPQNVVDIRRSPLALGVDENFRAEILSDPAAAQVQSVFVWFSDGAITPVEAPNEFTVRATGTTTLTANAWTACNLTLDDEIPPGDYSVTGLRVETAGCVAARLIFLGGGQNYRPGVLGCDVASDLQHEMFRHGNMGVFGTFPFTQLPQIEVCSVSADTAETVYLDLVKVG